MSHSLLPRSGLVLVHYFLLSRAGSAVCPLLKRFAITSTTVPYILTTSAVWTWTGIALFCKLRSGSLGYQICVFLAWCRGQIALHLPTPVFLRGSDTLKSTVTVLYPRSGCILVGGIFRASSLCAAEVGNFRPHLLNPKCSALSPSSSPALGALCTARPLSG